jgi:prepilin peptidase CpaA
MRSIITGSTFRLSMPLLIDITLLVFVCACCTVDVRTRRIPNALSGSALLLGATLNLWLHGTAGLVASLAGAGLMLGLLLVPFAFGGIGGGDVKMMIAVGAFVGPRLAFLSLTAGLIVGGLVMTLHLLRRGRLGEKLGALRAMVQSVVVTHSLAGLHISARDPGAISLPYSVPLGLGTLAIVFAGGVFSFQLHP